MDAVNPAVARNVAANGFAITNKQASRQRVILRKMEQYGCMRQLRGYDDKGFGI